MKVLVIPRDGNPYQELLYNEMRHLGVSVTYLAELTPVRTLNLLLLPLEVAARRIGGARLIHLHWVFAFAFPGRRFRVMRLLAHGWFLAWLWTCRRLGMRLVWTAHNVLPHEPVFVNDVAARRQLVAASDLVLAHSQITLLELRGLGAAVRRAAIIPHGPMMLPITSDSLRPPGVGDGPRRFLFFGLVREYKGIDDLLAAFAALPRGLSVELAVAGQCNDTRLLTHLKNLAKKCAHLTILRFERVSDEELTGLLALSDVVVLPFKRATTSGSAMLALCHGRPLIVSDLPTFADLPDDAVVRYGRTVEGLTDALSYLAQADGAELAAMSVAARRHVSGTTWAEIARKTTSEMSSLLNDSPPSHGPVDAGDVMVPAEAQHP